MESVPADLPLPRPGWPDPELGVDISRVPQITNGWARCTGAWLLDLNGNPACLFEQGQIACFHWEFEVLHDMQAPVGGLVINNENNVCVHGKSTLEYGAEVPMTVKAGVRLRFQQKVSLQLAVGHYHFDVGLTVISVAGYERRRRLTHAELLLTMSDLCELRKVGSFDIAFRKYPTIVQLMHHGIANLPGECSFSMTEAPAVPKPVVVAAAATQQPCTEPAIFHVTHWKAGSQWIYKVLKACAPDRIVSPEVGDTEVRMGARPGRIYPPVFMTHQEFSRLRLPDKSRHFVVIRDLRDTLVSAYFSMKLSHPGDAPELLRLREALASLGKDEGMLHLMDDWLMQAARIQQSWMESGEPVIRYEDLVDNDLEVFKRVLIDRCGLQIDPEVFAAAIANHRFANLTGGRQRGAEDIMSHERKGVAGDWKNHLSEPVKRAFKMRFGGLLAVTGYETNPDW